MKEYFLLMSLRGPRRGGGRSNLTRRVILNEVKDPSQSLRTTFGRIASHHFVPLAMTRIFCLLSMLLFSNLASADTYTIDNRYSTINFRIQHIMGYATGIFKTMNGTIELNDKNDAVTKLTGTIDMNSLDTKLADRDADLRSEHFFDVRQFPSAVFTSKKISKDKMIGDFTMHGVTKEITLDYKFLGTAKDQYGHDKTAISLSGTVNRKDFGVVYNLKTDDGKWLLGDDVELKIELEGIIQ